MIPLTGSNGLFTRLGRIAGQARLVNTWRGTDLPGHVEDLAAEYGGDPEAIQGLHRALRSSQSADGGYLGYLSGLARETVIRMAEQDTALPARTLAAALDELLEQMDTSGDELEASAVGAAVAAVGTPVGSPAIVVSVKDHGGRPLEYLVPEVVGVSVVSDAQAGGGAAAGAEVLRLRGESPRVSGLDYRYPAGSACDVRLTVLDSTGSRPLTRNGSWDTPSPTSSATPDKWVYATGVAGTNYTLASSPVTRGSKSLLLIGDGALVHRLYQPFGDGALGSAAQLRPSRTYSFALWARAGGAGVGTGHTLWVQLSDGAGAVTADGTGVNNRTSFLLDGLSTSAWTVVTGTFRTPAVNPASGYRVEVRIATSPTGTPISNGDNLYLDGFTFGEPSALYAGGPLVLAAAGPTNPVRGDEWTVTTTNDRAGVLADWCDRLLGLRQLGRRLPTGSSPTILDTLVTP